MRVGAFCDLMGRRPQKSRPFQVEPHRLAWYQKLPREGMPQYWHPNRFGVEPCPSWFAGPLADVSPRLAICRPPARAPVKTRAWYVWCQEPRVTHPLCCGWLLLMAWETPWKEPLPLDNRIFANLYLRDPRRYPSALHYFDRIMGEQKEKEDKEKTRFSGETMDMSLDVRNYRKIKNIGMGNKFALYHDGGLVPTMQEILWRKETLYQRLPDKVRQDAERDGTLTKATHSASVPARAYAPSFSFSQLEAAMLQRQLERQRELVSRRFFSHKRRRVGYTGPSR